MMVYFNMFVNYLFSSFSWTHIFNFFKHFLLIRKYYFLLIRKNIHDLKVRKYKEENKYYPSFHQKKRQFIYFWLLLVSLSLCTVILHFISVFEVRGYERLMQAPVYFHRFQFVLLSSNLSLWTSFVLIFPHYMSSFPFYL